MFLFFMNYVFSKIGNIFKGHYLWKYSISIRALQDGECYAQKEPNLPQSLSTLTLESGIDVGQGITVGPGKFVKKNKHRALNKCRA